MKTNTTSGNLIYSQYCVSCHKQDGKGISGTFPPLERSKKVGGDKKALITVLLHGMSGPVKIKGVDYDQQMPSFKFLNDKQLADVLSYIRSNFGNKAAPVTAAEVAKERKKK
jgi:mono/diheme cytochrome c family protein